MDYTKLLGWKLKLLNNGDIKTQPKWVSEWPKGCHTIKILYNKFHPSILEAHSPNIFYTNELINNFTWIDHKEEGQWCWQNHTVGIFLRKWSGSSQYHIKDYLGSKLRKCDQFLFNNCHIKPNIRYKYELIILIYGYYSENKLLGYFLVAHDKVPLKDPSGRYHFFPVHKKILSIETEC